MTTTIPYPTVYLLVFGGGMLVLAFALVVWVMYMVERIIHRFESARAVEQTLHRAEMDDMRAEVQAMTQAIARTSGMQVIYPRKGLEIPSEGWFDGKSRITKVNGEDV